MDKENKKISSAKTDVSPAEIKKLKKAEKKRKKFEKKELKRLKKEHAARAAIVPPSKRPIICPPDCSAAAKKHVYIGMFCRMLTIFVAVLGLALFVSEAFGFDMTPEYIAQKAIKNYGGIPAGAGFGFIALWALAFVALFALPAFWKYGAFITVPAIAAAIVVPALPNPITYFYEAALTVFNGALGHMKYMGFYAIDLKQVVNTNKALVHVAKYGSKLHITTAIDNLLKGASGQAVENMNRIFGLDPTTGLKLKASAF